MYALHVDKLLLLPLLLLPLVLQLITTTVTTVRQQGSHRKSLATCLAT